MNKDKGAATSKKKTFFLLLNELRNDTENPRAHNTTTKDRGAVNQTFHFKSLFNAKRWKFKSDKVSFRYTYVKYKNSPPLVSFAIEINKASIRETLYSPINMVINKRLADSKPFFHGGLLER